MTGLLERGLNFIVICQNLIFTIEMLQEISTKMKPFKMLWKISKIQLFPISRYLLKYKIIWVAEHWPWGFSLVSTIIRFWLLLIMTAQKNLYMLEIIGKHGESFQHWAWSMELPT